ncbi:hypothetical protein Tharo_2841 [Thauera aromatica K172]|uniref:Uncharacterized protein n=1 Tax=Thauera aromatica K172 TaxID=44139 RepID=A0A2R4BR90_THAAR|nr:hypothetical protein Tharo_2841 [Thauera aromatica K172]
MPGRRWNARARCAGPCLEPLAGRFDSGEHSRRRAGALYRNADRGGGEGVLMGLCIDRSRGEGSALDAIRKTTGRPRNCSQAGTTPL